MSSWEPEAPYDPVMPIWDAHHHLYPDGQQARYRVPELLADMTSGHHVVGTTFVETSGHGYLTDGDPLLAPVGETAWVAAQAIGSAPGAIIGYVDMMAGAEVGRVLDAHLAAGDGRFRGIRFRRNAVGQPQPPARFHLHETLGAAVRVLTDRGLLYESSFPSAELPEFAMLADGHPSQLLLADHLGGPVRTQGLTQRELMARWRTDLRRLARCDNVVLKIGGVGMSSMTRVEELGGPLDSVSLAAHWGSAVREAIEVFGPDRCMFESNYPRDGELVAYSTLWNTYQRIVSDFSHDERKLLFAGTAVRVFRPLLDRAAAATVSLTRSVIRSASALPGSDTANPLAFPLTAGGEGAPFAAPSAQLRHLNISRVSGTTS